MAVLEDEYAQQMLHWFACMEDADLLGKQAAYLRHKTSKRSLLARKQDRIRAVSMCDVMEARSAISDLLEMINKQKEGLLTAKLKPTPRDVPFPAAALKAHLPLLKTYFGGAFEPLAHAIALGELEDARSLTPLAYGALADASHMERYHGLLNQQAAVLMQAQQCLENGEAHRLDALQRSLSAALDDEYVRLAALSHQDVVGLWR